MGSFGAAFLAGLQRGRDELERKREAEEARRQREVGNQITARNLALQDIDLAAKMPAQQEQLPEGVMGPPRTIRRTVTVPGVPSLGIAGREVEPLTMTDLLTQRRADEDVKQASALERLKAELGIKKEAEAIPITEQIASLFGGALTPGESISPEQAKLASAGFQGQENRKSREQIAAESAAVRRDATAQRAHEKELAGLAKKAAAEDDVSFFAQRIHSGDLALDSPSIPQKLKASAGILADVLNRQSPGLVFATTKDKDKYKGFEDVASQAQELLDNFEPRAVGPFDNRLPTFKAKTAYYESQVAGMFNELGKLRSGGAITPQEYDRLAKEIPQVTDYEDVFKAKAQRFIDEMRKRQGKLVSGGLAARGSAEAQSTPAGAPDAEALRKKYGY